MRNQKDFLTREEALARLGVKTATLYSYVSRGLIRSVEASGSNRHLYARDDIDRFAARGRGRVPRSVAAAASMRWGEPIINSSITYIDDRGPVYRNRHAVDIAQSGISFEILAHFLFTGVWQEGALGWPMQPVPEDVQALLDSYAGRVDADDIGNLMAMVVLALGMHGRDEQEMANGSTVPAARLIIQTFVGCLGFLSAGHRFVARQPSDSLAVSVCRAAGIEPRPEALRALNATLVLLADHELAPATFAVRVAASINTGLCNCIAAAISAHVGFSTGAVTERVESQLLNLPTKQALDKKIELVRDYGENLFGFNHPLYPHGDPRADLILELAEACAPHTPSVRAIFAFLRNVRDQIGARPGIAIALVVLARVLGLPRGAATALWIAGRTAGWVAHVSEQRTQAFMLRPRAKFVPALKGGKLL